MWLLWRWKTPSISDTKPSELLKAGTPDLREVRAEGWSELSPPLPGPGPACPLSTVMLLYLAAQCAFFCTHLSPWISGTRRVFPEFLRTDSFYRPFFLPGLLNPLNGSRELYPAITLTLTGAIPGGTGPAPHEARRAVLSPLHFEAQLSCQPI